MGGTPVDAATSRWRPNGLMHRLADLKLEVGFEPGRAALPFFEAPAPLPGYFALGLGVSLVLGALAYLGLLSLDHKGGSGPSPAALSVAPRHQLVLDLPIGRGDAATSFALSVSGLEAVRNAHVVLQDLPEAVSFSRGERRDEHTWDLERGDLNDLQLTLRQDAPEAFVFGIDVVGANNALLARTAAHVHRLERSEASAPPRARTAALPPPRPERPTLDWSSSTFTKQFVPREALMSSSAPLGEPVSTAPQDKIAANLAASSTSPQRPKGMSGLGALSHEEAVEGRWLWWKLPSPAWAPFASLEGAGR
jgi:hypothetical protein